MVDEIEIQQLLIENPESAVDKVRVLGSSPEERKQKADTFIDAGIALNRPYLIRAGNRILRHECGAGNGTAEHHYSLANGLSAYSEIYDGIHQSEKLRVRLDSEARSHYGDVLSAKEADFQVRSQAATNIANHLNKRGRYIEALDYYAEALRLMPMNAVAAAGELSLLKELGYFIHNESKWYRFYGDFTALLRRTTVLRDVISENLNVLEVLAGSHHIPYALQLIENTPIFDLPEEIEIEPLYERWVSANMLALSLCCSGEEYNSKKYDLLVLPSFVADDESGNRPPEVFAMINVIKSDYVFARRLLFDAVNAEFPETANYSDTLDYATYGINVSALAVAQKTAIDVLDKISVVIAVLLKLPSPEFFQFKKQAFWRREKSTEQWVLTHEAVEREISSGNNSLRVILDLVSDLYDKDGGYLSSLSSLRNIATHRFHAVHDLTFFPDEQGAKYVDHIQQDEFEMGAMKSLRVARACIFYLIDFIKRLDSQKERESRLRVTLDVPDHHWVRGED
jgi:hypothetical protein